MVLVDTSVWIDFFSRKNSPVRDDLQMVLRVGDVAVAGVVLAELRRGCRTSAQTSQLTQMMEPLIYLEAERNSWVHAGEIAAECSARGFQVGVADCLLAALAEREHATIFTLDRDFERIPGIQLFRRSGRSPKPPAWN